MGNRLEELARVDTLVRGAPYVVEKISERRSDQSLRAALSFAGLKFALEEPLLTVFLQWLQVAKTLDHCDWGGEKEAT